MTASTEFTLSNKNIHKIIYITNTQQPLKPTHQTIENIQNIPNEHIIWILFWSWSANNLRYFNPVMNVGIWKKNAEQSPLLPATWHIRFWINWHVLLSKPVGVAGQVTEKESSLGVWVLEPLCQFWIEENYLLSIIRFSCKNLSFYYYSNFVFGKTMFKGTKILYLPMRVEQQFQLSKIFFFVINHVSSFCFEFGF